MSAVLKSADLTRYHPTQRQVADSPRSAIAPFPPRSRHEKQQLIRQKRSSLQPLNAKVVRSLPQFSTPPWLRLLILVQRGSTIVTALLAITVLALYGWTVHTQQRWSKEYGRLEHYRQQERQLNTVSESIKHSIANQAESVSSGLAPATPAQMVFVKAAPPRPVSKPLAPPVDPDVQPKQPLGY